MAKKNSKKTVPELRFRGFTDPWEQRQLGEVGLTYPGLSGKTKEDFGHGDARFVTYMNVYSNAVVNPDGVEAIEKDNRQHEVRNGDVFFTGSSETPDEVGLSSVWLGNSTDTYLNSFCFGYRPSKQLDSLFLASSLRSPQMRSRIILLAQGISRFNISKTQVMQLPLCFPSLPEQRRVGEFFSAIDNLIAAAERQEALLRQKKQAYLQLMFPQDGETEPRLRFAGFSGEWEQRQASDQFVAVKESHHADLPVLSATQNEGMVYRDDLDIDIKFKEDALESYKMVRPGDFVISLRSFQGGFELSDKTGIVSPAYTVFTHAEISSQDNQYWKQYFKRKAFIESLKTVTFGIRDGKAISFSDFSSLKCSFPSLPEQRRIGGFFSTLDNLIAAAEQRAESLRALKSAYLQRMFA